MVELNFPLSIQVDDPISIMPKNILLIGGNSGIGLATARLLHASGHSLVAAARQAGPLAEMGIPVQPFDAAAPALNDLPPVLDGLVYFPGSITLKPFHRVTAEDFINDFQTNCLGAAAAISAGPESSGSARSTSVPKPLQLPHPPLWVAARAPITYDFAVKHGLNIMSWPLTRPMSEAELYKSRLDEAMANNPGKARPIFAMMRHTALYDRKEDWMVPVRAAQRQLGQFENLFKNLGDVRNGFPKEVDLHDIANRSEYDPQMLSTNLMFGTPDEVIAKLKPYQALGVDEFTYYAEGAPRLAGAPPPVGMGRRGHGVGFP